MRIYLSISCVKVIKYLSARSRGNFLHFSLFSEMNFHLRISVLTYLVSKNTFSTISSFYRPSYLKEVEFSNQYFVDEKIAHFGIITPNLMNSIFTRVKWIQIIPQWYLNFERLTHSVPNFEMEIFNLMLDIFWRTFRPKTLLTFDKYRYVLKIGWFRA